MSRASAEKRSAALPAGKRRNPEGYLFEVAWEVCQQLGGIYTVIRSKIPSMIERWGKWYCLIGPYNPATAAIEFDEAEPPDLCDPRSRHYTKWVTRRISDTGWLRGGPR